MVIETKIKLTLAKRMPQEGRFNSAWKIKASDNMKDFLYS